MTGESLPMDKGVGHDVSSGTVNQFGAFEMEAVRVGEDSSIQRTIRINLSFSMALNFAAIVLAITGILNPVVGALVHNTGSVLVITSSALLLNWRRKA